MFHLFLTALSSTFRLPSSFSTASQNHNLLML
jgi:hypothetical protein